MQLPDDIRYRWLTYADEKAAAWQAMLTPAERARLATFGSARRRRAFVTGRAAARQLLAEVLAVPPHEVPLRVADDEAVEVDESPYAVSITHAGPYAVAAVGRRRLGVDLEAVVERHSDLQRFLLHPDEYGLLEELPLDRTQALILCWTLKEAVLKAQRTGLRCSPHQLRLAIDIEAQAARVQTRTTTWEARFLERQGYYLSLAFE